MVQSKASITAIGSFVPEKRLTNDDLEKMVETNDEWITSRTGIKERRITAEDEFTSTICVKAAEELQQVSGKALDDVDLIIVCTLTPDHKTPSVASLVQASLGISGAGAFDLNAACAGFSYGLHMADGMVSSGLHRKVLVIGAETLSKITDYTDRATCILFGDGAGAALVEADESNPSFLAALTDSDGKKGEYLYCTDLSNQIGGHEVDPDGYVVQNGREVYKWAVKTVPQGIDKLLNDAGVAIEDIDWFAPHSANMRMIESICERTGIPVEKTLTSLEYYGNTSSATIPLSLREAQKDGRLKNGDLVLIYGFGGGLAQSALLVRWHAE